MTLTITPTPTVNITTPTKEVFNLLVFHNDGTCSIQTNTSIYFFANAYFHAAAQLARLLQDNNPKLEYGIVANMVDPNNPPPNKCLINEDLLTEALSADKIESTHPGVVNFFSFLKELTR